MNLIWFYVPASHCETVKQAMFVAGAGKLGKYDNVCWQTQGKGQFRPLTGARPYQGELGKIEQAVEYKVEMICENKFVSNVVAAMKDTHPYEEPAYVVVKMEDY